MRDTRPHCPWRAGARRGPRPLIHVFSAPARHRPRQSAALQRNAGVPKLKRRQALAPTRRPCRETKRSTPVPKPPRRQREPLSCSLARTNREHCSHIVRGVRIRSQGSEVGRKRVSLFKLPQARATSQLRHPQPKWRLGRNRRRVCPTLLASRLLIYLRRVGTYPVYSLILGRKALDAPLVALMISYDDVPPRPRLVLEGHHHWFFVRICHSGNMHFGRLRRYPKKLPASIKLTPAQARGLGRFSDCDTSGYGAAPQTGSTRPATITAPASAN